jgi:hypothetical protein
MDTERIQLLQELVAAMEEARDDGIPSFEDIVTQALTSRVDSRLDFRRLRFPNPIGHLGRLPSILVQLAWLFAGLQLRLWTQQARTLARPGWALTFANLLVLGLWGSSVL